ncbi:MAG: DUF2589 domain-containing protein [Bacteroidales bacterium]|nr:DUF2589 domain-containing protein [Bacteroidales bacterium]
MGIFDKRPKYAFSDILKGLHNAVNSAQDMLQAQQVQNLRRFWNPEDGEPLSQKIKIGDKEMNVPLMSLVSHSHLEMDDVEIKFKAKIGAVASDSMSDGVVIGSPLTHSDLKMEMEGIKATDDDVMEVTIRFSQKDTPEGVARLTDEYNKLI